MKRISHPVSGLIGVLLLMLARPVQAVLTLGAVTAGKTNTSAFLLEAEALSADPAANREAVNAVLGVQLSNPSLIAADEIEIEATFSLVGQSDGLPVTLQTGGTTVVVTSPFTLPASSPAQTVVLAAALHPAAALDPVALYRVGCSMRTRPVGGEWSAPSEHVAGWDRWVHFFNAAADDASVNVKAFTDTLAVADRQILRSVPSQTEFAATMQVRLHRYDLETVPQVAAQMPVTFALRLINKATLVEVPLASPSITVPRSLLAVTADSPPDPVTDEWEQTLTFAPAAGELIDPTANYHLEVIVTAAEPDSTPIPVVQAETTAAAKRYLVLSGVLMFGDVETVFTQLGNDPSPPMELNMGVYRTKVAVAAQSGTASAVVGRTYGDGVEMDVTYHPASGALTVTGGTQAFDTAGTDMVTLNGLRLLRGPIQLSAGGALMSSGGVFFPAGFGVSTTQNSRRHQPALTLQNELLDASLFPRFATKNFTPTAAPHFYAFCDRLPIRFRTSVISWDVNAGTFEFSQVDTGDPADPAGPVLTRLFQEQALAEWLPLLADAYAANRPSNDAFMRNITSTSPITISSGSLGEALLRVQFDLGDGQMQTHYPQGVTVSWSSGRFTVQDNVITGPNYLTTDNPITVSYKRDCMAPCTPTSGPGQFVFTPSGNTLNITADGGLRAEGSTLSERLRWGTTQLSGGASPPEGGAAYAQQTSQWDAGAFHVAGTWLSGEVNLGTLPEGNRAEAMLLSGVLADGSYERPLTAGYSAGLADYAGLNLRVGTAGAKTGRSVMTGRTTPDYELKAYCKYYVRTSGVTGIHDAVALIPSNLMLYKFDVHMDGLRLAYRDGVNVESKIGGSIYVDCPDPAFAGFDLDFKDLMFNCAGQPEKMKLATHGETKSLAYWGTDFTPLSFEFAQPKPAGGTCPAVDEGFLLVGVQTRFPSVTPQKLHATLGFLPSGNLVTKKNPMSAGLEIDSRFVLPPNLEIVGAGGVPWQVTVTGPAYLNNPLPESPLPPGFVKPANGFLTFPATINVPWFEDVKVQFQVSASSTANAASTVIHVMGGWAADPRGDSSPGWQVGGKHYFNDKLFDDDHIAYPTSVTLDDYRNPNTPVHNPRAQKRWLGVVDFDLPLVWERTARRFSSAEQSADLLVLGSVARRVQSLTPSTAEITFGVKLDVPSLNTQSLTAAVKEGLSGAMADALTDAIGPALKSQLGGGLAEFDALLSERLSSALVVPLAVGSGAIADTILQPGGTAASQLPALRSMLVTLPDGGLNTDVANRLNQGISAIQAARDIVGLQGDRSLVGNLVRELVKQSGVPGAAGLAESAVNTALAEALPEIEPDFQQAAAALNSAEAALVAAQGRLLFQVPALFQETKDSLNAAANLAILDIDNEMTKNSWTLLSTAAKRERIIRLIEERVMASAMVPKFQYIVRQNVQDTSQVFRAALDDILGQVSYLVRGVIERTVDGLGDDVISAAVGDMGPSSGGSGKLAAINISGYAQINDESLRLLDINGKFEFNIPDSLKVQAHLRIEEFDADTPPAGCRDVRGSTAALVTVDARAECEGFASAGTILEVGAKFSLFGGSPVGFDGHFGFKGEIKVGPVTLNEFRVTAGFGTNPSAPTPVVWAYIGGNARGRYGGYEAAAGIFLGRTCGVEFLRTIDPTAELALSEAKVDTSVPITGVYFYGEAWFPLNEVFGIPSSCMLTLKGGAGSGFFAFFGKKNGADAVFVGCKQLYGVEGTVLCALTARGTMTIFGAAAVEVTQLPVIGNPSDTGIFAMAKGFLGDLGDAVIVIHGEGEFSLQFGYCPACIELSRTLGLTWTIKLPKPSLKVHF